MRATATMREAQSSLLLRNQSGSNTRGESRTSSGRDVPRSRSEEPEQGEIISETPVEDTGRAPRRWKAGKKRARQFPAGLSARSFGKQRGFWPFHYAPSARIAPV